MILDKKRTRKRQVLDENKRRCLLKDNDNWKLITDVRQTAKAFNYLNQGPETVSKFEGKTHEQSVQVDQKDSSSEPPKPQTRRLDCPADPTASFRLTYIKLSERKPSAILPDLECR